MKGLRQRHIADEYGAKIVSCYPGATARREIGVIMDRNEAIGWLQLIAKTPEVELIYLRAGDCNEKFSPDQVKDNTISLPETLADPIVFTAYFSFDDATAIGPMKLGERLNEKRAAVGLAPLKWALVSAAPPPSATGPQHGRMSYMVECRGLSHSRV